MLAIAGKNRIFFRYDSTDIGGGRMQHVIFVDAEDHKPAPVASAEFLPAILSVPDEDGKVRVYSPDRCRIVDSIGGVPVLRRSLPEEEDTLIAVIICDGGHGKPRVSSATDAAGKFEWSLFGVYTVTVVFNSAEGSVTLEFGDGTSRTYRWADMVASITL